MPCRLMSIGSSLYGKTGGKYAIKVVLAGYLRLVAKDRYATTSEIMQILFCKQGYSFDIKKFKFIMIFLLSFHS